MWRVEDQKVEIFWGDPSWLHKRRASSIWREARGKVMMRKHARLKKPFVQNWPHTFFFIKVVLLWSNRFASAFYRDLSLDGHKTYLVESAKVNRKGHGSGIFPPPAKWSNTVVDHQSRSEVVLTSGLVIPHPPSPLLGPHALKTHLLCTQESKIVMYYYGVSLTFFCRTSQSMPHKMTSYLHNWLIAQPSCDLYLSP